MYVPTFVTTRDNLRSPDETFTYIVTLANWTEFRGYGFLPGIVEASLPDGAPIPPASRQVALGSRIRVENTDGSVHHEVVQAFEPGRRYAIRMELAPPVSYLMARIDERVDLEATPTGTRVTRTFDVVPRGWWTAPLVWLVAKVLRRAVVRHDEAVAGALGG